MLSSVCHSIQGRSRRNRDDVDRAELLRAGGAIWINEDSSRHLSVSDSRATRARNRIT